MQYTSPLLSHGKKGDPVRTIPVGKAMVSSSFFAAPTKEGVGILNLCCGDVVRSLRNKVSLLKGSVVLVMAAPCRLRIRSHNLLVHLWLRFSSTMKTTVG